MQYAALLLPSANRVYAESSRELMAAELTVFGQTLLDTALSEVTSTRIGGVHYVTFTTDKELSPSDVAALSNVSALYALYAMPDSELLRPITMSPLACFGDDLLTVQKYPGKTNEQFTKLLVNLTCLAMADPHAWLNRPLRLIDPLCGRGTTLNQAMMYGFDATGVELDGKDFDAYERFIKTWLRGKRLKHTADSGQLRQHKQKLGRRLDISYATSKEAFKAGDVRTLAYRAMDTLRADELFAANSFDVLVTDAPYGVQHGSQRGSALQRNPRDLLAAAIGGWTRLLRHGGAIGISWNTTVLPRAELLDLLADAGLQPREGGPYEEFSHRVDHAIVRDLVVAAKPG